MLELARTGFINLYDSDHGNFAKINYPDGLFAPNPAVREKHSADVTQYTGKDLDREPADKIIAEWNKKVKTWLSDYHVTDIKKNTKGDIKLNTDEEETVYTKKNAQGVKIFVVTVFKEVVGEGSEAEPMSFTTGVRISN